MPSEKPSAHMQTKIRAHNLFLARSITGGEAGQLAALQQAIPQSTLQNQVKGKKAITAADTNRYAEAFGLPPDWFDRDNEGLLRMSDVDYSLVKVVLQLQANQKTGLLALLKPSRKN